jgi:hypothetical protein
MPIQDVLAFAAGGIAILTFIGLLHRMFLSKIIREWKEFLTWMRKFQRDWDGEPAHPGRDAVPGVMERLNRIDGELKRNGGSTLKDKVFETWEKVESLDERVDTIEIRQCEIQKAIERSK